MLCLIITDIRKFVNDKFQFANFDRGEGPLTTWKITMLRAA